MVTGFYPTTPVLTERGWLPIAEVPVNLKVFTHEGRFMPVVSKHKTSIRLTSDGTIAEWGIGPTEGVKCSRGRQFLVLNCLAGTHPSDSPENFNSVDGYTPQWVGVLKLRTPAPDTAPGSSIHLGFRPQLKEELWTEFDKFLGSEAAVDLGYPNVVLLPPTKWVGYRRGSLHDLLVAEDLSFTTPLGVVRGHQP